MARTSRRTRSRLLAEINVVPYIDVMLVLLVIFMVTTPLLDEGIKVSLPKAQASETDKTTQVAIPIVVKVKEDGKVLLTYKDFKETLVTDTELVALVKPLLKDNADLQIQIKGDAKANYEYIIHTVDVLRKSGVKKVNFITKAIIEE